MTLGPAQSSESKSMTTFFRQLDLKTVHSTAGQAPRRRILFASVHSVLDFSNGASVATLDVLQGLTTQGFRLSGVLYGQARPAYGGPLREDDRRSARAFSGSAVGPRQRSGQDPLYSPAAGPDYPDPPGSRPGTASRRLVRSARSWAFFRRFSISIGPMCCSPMAVIRSRRA